MTRPPTTGLHQAHSDCSLPQAQVGEEPASHHKKRNKKRGIRGCKRPAGKPDGDPPGKHSYNKEHALMRIIFLSLNL